ncbi:MAG: hypothetical protein AAGE65_10455, partial [Planctomycetota bacterium]
NPSPAPGGSSGNTPGTSGDTPGGEPGKKRKRRRRGGRRNRGNKPAGEPTNTQANADAKPAPGGETDAKTKPTREKPDQARDGSRGKPPRSDGRPPRGAAKNKPGGPNAKNADAPKPRKKRKPRTKQCVNCFMPCTTIHKVRLDHRKQWSFICDICWPTRCLDNPHYEYEALWVSGRLLHPGRHDDRDEKKSAKPKPNPDHADARPPSSSDGEPSPQADAAGPQG